MRARLQGAFMKANQLTLRCFGEKKDGQWTLVCIDLCLAVQATSIEKAKAKLESQIKEYIYDALVGEDKDHAESLLNRKAPLSLVVKYYRNTLFVGLSKLTQKVKLRRLSFTETLPLKPC